MSFALTNALAVFRGQLNKILSDKIDWGVVVYIDDILIYTDMEEVYIELIR